MSTKPQYQHFDLDEFQQFSENILISSPHNFWMGFLNFNLVPTMVVSLAVQRNQTNFHYWNSFQNLFIYIQVWTWNHKVFLCISAFLLKWKKYTNIFFRSTWGNVQSKTISWPKYLERPSLEQGDDYSGQRSVNEEGGRPSITQCLLRKTSCLTKIVDQIKTR